MKKKSGDFKQRSTSDTDVTERKVLRTKKRQRSSPIILSFQNQDSLRILMHILSYNFPRAVTPPPSDTNLMFINKDATLGLDKLRRKNSCRYFSKENYQNTKITDHLALGRERRVSVAVSAFRI